MADAPLLSGLQSECDRSRAQAAKLRRRLDEERAHSLRLTDQLRQMTTAQQQLQQQLRLAVGSSGCSAGASSSQPKSINSLQRALEAEKCRLDQEKRANGELAAERKRLAAAQSTAAAERHRLLAVNESVRASLNRKERELAAMHILLRERGVALERAHEQIVLQARAHEAEQAQAATRFRELTLAVQRDRQRAARRASHADALEERPSEEQAQALQPAPGYDASASAGGTIFGYANQPGASPCGELTCGRATLCKPPLDFEGPTAAAFASMRSTDGPSACAGISSPAQEMLLSLQREVKAARLAEREVRRDAKEAREEKERVRTQLRLVQHALVDQKAERVYDAAHRHRERPRRRAASTADLGCAQLGDRPRTAGGVWRQRPAPVLLHPHASSLRRTAAAVQSAGRVLLVDGEDDNSDSSEGEHLEKADSGGARAGDGEYVPGVECCERAAGLGSGWPGQEMSQDGAEGGDERGGVAGRDPSGGAARDTPAVPGHRCAPTLPARAAVATGAETRAAGGSVAELKIARAEEAAFGIAVGGASARSGGSSVRGSAVDRDGGGTAVHGGEVGAWSATSSARRSGGGQSARGAISPLRGSIGARARSALERIEASMAQLDSVDGLRGPPSPEKLMLDAELGR